jgi:hypothetical protein
MNVKIEAEAAQYLFWEYRNRNFFAVYSAVNLVSAIQYHGEEKD